MVCDSKLHAIILWCVMSVKLIIGKKIAGLEIMTLDRKKKIACLQARTDV